MTKNYLFNMDRVAGRQRSFALDLLKGFHQSTIRFRTKLPWLPALMTANEQMLNRAFQFALYNQVPGDYLEFGSYEGNSMITAYHLARVLGMERMRFYAFDSFEGLPETQEPYRRGDYRCSLERFSKNLSSGGVDLSRVRTVAGYYDQTLNADTKKDLPLTSAAIVLIDCDLYESARAALDFVTDYLTEGSLVLFDDWYCFKGSPDRGEQRAFYEWLERNPSVRAVEFLKYNWQGNSFIIHKGSP